jgi:hypothetical protein
MASRARAFSLVVNGVRHLKTTTQPVLALKPEVSGPSLNFDGALAISSSRTFSEPISISSARNFRITALAIASRPTAIARLR